MSLTRWNSKEAPETRQDASGMPGDVLGVWRYAQEQWKARVPREMPLPGLLEYQRTDLQGLIDTPGYGEETVKKMIDSLTINWSAAQEVFDKAGRYSLLKLLTYNAEKLRKLDGRPVLSGRYRGGSDIEEAAIEAETNIRLNLRQMKRDMEAKGLSMPRLWDSLLEEWDALHPAEAIQEKKTRIEGELDNDVINLVVRTTRPEEYSKANTRRKPSDRGPQGFQGWYVIQGAQGAQGFQGWQGKIGKKEVS